MAFPQTPLSVLVELQLAGVWTDITSDVLLRDKISITRGRADEAARVDPGRCTLTLNNRSGKYSSRNPLSPYYGLIGRNTPLRVSVPVGETYLNLPGAAGDRIGTPDHSSLDITGDIDVRIEATLDVWGGSGAGVELLGKYDTTGNQRSYRLFLTDTGLLALAWSTDGTGTNLIAATSTASIYPPASSGRFAIRATLDVNNGSGGWTATYYTATSIAGPWTQVGAAVTGVGVTSIYSGSAPLQIGEIASTSFTPPSGRIHKFELRNGIAGSVVANPDFTIQSAGATSFTDGAGRTWTVEGGAQLTNRRVRFHGEVSSWPPRWDTSGRDVWTPIEAAGLLRRLGQGAAPLQSTLRRRIPRFTPLAYWPMEEGDTATQAYSPITGVNPLRTTGFDWASDDSLAGSSALPQISDPATMTGTVPAPASAQTSWHTEFVMKMEAAPSTNSTVMRYLSTGTVATWSLQLASGQARVLGEDVYGTNIVDQLVAVGSDLYDGRWNRWQFYASSSGGTVTWTINWVNVGGSSGGASNSYSGTLGRITTVCSPTTFNSALDGMRLGHISVFSPSQLTAYNLADHGFNGEVSGERMLRVAYEEGIPFTVYGDRTEQMTMGPQRPITILDLLGEGADADGGILYERRDAAELAYRGRVTLYSQAVALALNYATDGHVAPPLEPVDDDQKVRNDITVERSGGSSARVTLDTGALSTAAPPNGVGTYDESVTLNLYSDDQPEDIAGWRLHLGTWDEARYPSVSVDLAAAPSLTDSATALECGDRITISNPPSWLPPDTIDLLVQGYSEVLGLYDWDLTFNCTPAGPWNVAVTDHATYGRADTDGSQLNAAATSTATSLSVATTSGPLWTTSAGDMPFDIRVGGEIIRVTAVSGASSPQTFTVTRSINGVVKAQSSGAAVALAYPSIAAL